MIAPQGLRLTTLSELIHSRQHSSEEVTKAYLARIERYNPKLNAYLSVFKDEAVAQARAADSEIANAKIRGPLHGIPIAVKDIMDIRGHAMTAGGKILSKEPATEDAPVIAKLREAGAVILGTLNLHEFAWGASTDNPHYGKCFNPWKEGFTPGGSSGGSGAAVAAGLCAAALGTDTLGSIRIPSSYCGCVGVKPTNGLVSARGVFPLSWTLDTVGPLARCVEDAAVLLRAIAGPDKADPYSAQRGMEDFKPSERPSLSGMRIGVISIPSSGPRAVDEAVGAAFKTAVEQLVALGARRIDLDLPDWSKAGSAAMNITLAEAAAIHEKNLAEHADDIGNDVRRLLTSGANLNGGVVVNAYHDRMLLRARMHEIMEQVDCIVTPSTPNTARAFGARGGGSVAGFLSPCNVLGLPAVSVPCGFSPEGLPIGLQIVAHPFAEATALRVAQAFEISTSWHERRPPGFDMNDH